MTDEIGFKELNTAVAVVRAKSTAPSAKKVARHTVYKWVIVPDRTQGDCFMMRKYKALVDKDIEAYEVSSDQWEEWDYLFITISGRQAYIHHMPRRKNDEEWNELLAPICDSEDHWSHSEEWDAAAKAVDDFFRGYKSRYSVDIPDALNTVIDEISPNGYNFMSTFNKILNDSAKCMALQMGLTTVNNVHHIKLNISDTKLQTRLTKEFEEQLVEERRKQLGRDLTEEDYADIPAIAKEKGGKAASKGVMRIINECLKAAKQAGWPEQEARRYLTTMSGSSYYSGSGTTGVRDNSKLNYKFTNALIDIAGKFSIDQAITFAKEYIGNNNLRWCSADVAPIFSVMKADYNDGVQYPLLIKRGLVDLLKETTLTFTRFKEMMLEESINQAMGMELEEWARVWYEDLQSQKQVFAKIKYKHSKCYVNQRKGLGLLTQSRIHAASALKIKEAIRLDQTTEWRLKKLTLNKWNMVMGPYIVKVLDSHEMFAQEAAQMSNCLIRMGYDDKVLKGKSLIFSVREKLNPNVPVADAEFDPTNDFKLVQCYGYNNEPAPFGVKEMLLDAVSKKRKDIEMGRQKLSKAPERRIYDLWTWLVEYRNAPLDKLKDITELVEQFMTGIKEAKPVLKQLESIYKEVRAQKGLLVEDASGQTTLDIQDSMEVSEDEDIDALEAKEDE